MITFCVFDCTLFVDVVCTLIDFDWAEVDGAGKILVGDLTVPLGTIVNLAGWAVVDCTSLLTISPCNEHFLWKIRWPWFL